MTPVNHWQDNPAHPVDDWKYEVANDQTRLGHIAWIDARTDQPGSDHKPHPASRTFRRQAVRIRATDRAGNVAYIHREENRPMRCTLANGISAAFFYAGIIADEMACRFLFDDCETADHCLAIVRRYGSLDYDYRHVDAPPASTRPDQRPASPALFARLTT